MKKLLFASALLFCSQAFACTGIQLKNKDGTFVHGRTVEFGTPIEMSVLAIPRNAPFTAKIPGGSGMRYQAKYASIGIMVFNEPVLMDGINERGLAAAAFYFPSFATYAKIEGNQAKAVSPIDFVNWVVTQFATVDEVKKAIESKQVVIAPTVYPQFSKEPPPMHYIVYDRSGKSLVIEPTDGELKVFDNPTGAITNSPTFDWHLTNLRNYISLNPRNVPPVELDGMQLKQLGQGSGMHGLPGDFTPPSRFIRAVVFSAAAYPSPNAQEGVFQVFHILNNFDIPVGVAREVHEGKVQTDYTLLTLARDPQNLKFYYKTYNDQAIREVDLKKMGLEKLEVMKINQEKPQTVIEVAGG